MKVIGAALITLSSWAGLTLVFAFLDWIRRDQKQSLFYYVMEVVPWTALIVVIVGAFVVGMALMDEK